MAAPARTTQSLALLACEGPEAAAINATQSLVLIASAGGTPVVTQSLALLACGGPEQQAAFVTQSLALIACEGPEALTVNATQSLVLVAAPSPAPSRVTQVNILVAADRDTTGPTITQALILVCSEDAAAAVEGPRITQGTVLLACDRDTTGPVVTQALALVASGPTCPDASEGGFGLRELGRRVIRMLGEMQATDGYWTVAEIHRLVSMAMVDIVRDTKMYEFIDTQTTTAETRYELPAGAMQVFRAFLGDARIRPVTAWELDRERGDWEGSDTTARYYVNVPGAVVLDGVPDAGVSLALWVTGVPDALEDVCDEPPGPTWWHLAVAYRAASLALSKYGEQGNRPLARAYRAISDDYASLLAAHVAGRLQ
jgi:hypothetical protein